MAEQEMQFFTYTARSLREMTDLIKRNHGEDALILKSRQIRPKSQLEDELWEAVVGVPKTPKQATKSPTNVPANPPAPANPPPPVSPKIQARLYAEPNAPKDATDDDLPDNAAQKRLNAIAQKEIERKKELRERQRLEIGAQIQSAVREISKLVPPEKSRGGGFNGGGFAGSGGGGFSGSGFAGGGGFAGNGGFGGGFRGGESSASFGGSRGFELSEMPSPDSRSLKEPPKIRPDGRPAESRFAESAPASNPAREPLNPREGMPPRQLLPRQDSSQYPLDFAQNREQNAARRFDARFDSRLDARLDEGANLKQIQQDVAKLNDRFKIMQNMMWSELNIKAAQKPSLPPEFAEIYRICKNSGMSAEHLDAIMSQSAQLMPSKMLENSTVTKRNFREFLRKTITCRLENSDMKRKRIVMFVGPTGVGKTTTLVKLAARYSRTLRQKVGLVALDDYRIGAFDQLSFFSRKLQLSLIKADDMGDFTEALDAFRDCDYILIDTFGSSQKDAQKLEILRRYATHKDYNIDVNLVLCANTKLEDLRDTYNAFSALNVDTLIFSKLDESSGFGNVFSLAYDTQKPISYFTTGQEVPEDIAVADNGYLADCIIYGFTKPSQKGAQKGINEEPSRWPR